MEVCVTCKHELTWHYNTIKLTHTCQCLQRETHRPFFALTCTKPQFVCIVFFWFLPEIHTRKLNAAPHDFYWYRSIWLACVVSVCDSGESLTYHIAQKNWKNGNLSQWYFNLQRFSHLSLMEDDSMSALRGRRCSPRPRQSDLQRTAVFNPLL